MKTPKHFSCSTIFTLFIYECAIRDRGTLIDAYTPKYSVPSKEDQKIIDESIEEIKSIKFRKKILLRK